MGGWMGKDTKMKHDVTVCTATFLYGSPYPPYLLNNCRCTAPKTNTDFNKYAYGTINHRRISKWIVSYYTDTKLAEAFHLDRLARLDAKQRREICKIKNRGFHFQPRANQDASEKPSVYLLLF